MAYNSVDETLADWATRHLEQDAAALQAEELRARVPQTAPVPEELPTPTLPMMLRRIADALEAQEMAGVTTADALAMVDDVPPELYDALARALGVAPPDDDVTDEPISDVE